MKRIISLGLAALIASFGMSCSQEEITPAKGRIAFEATEGRTREVFVMNADGGSRTNLTNNKEGDDTQPSWSNDGKKIVFASNRDGNEEIYVMNSDGTDQRNLTNNPANDIMPKLSPDGSRLAFVSDRDGNREIYVMNSDGTEQTRLTDNPNTDKYNRCDDIYPSWSPDGERIVYASRTQFTLLGIHVMNNDGTGKMRLTRNPANNTTPELSPDGKRVAFVSWYKAKGPLIRLPMQEIGPDIYTINIDGSGLNKLTNTKVHESSPTWSPDGKHIAYRVYSEGGNIYVMNSDGSKKRNITNMNFNGGSSPSWSPLLSGPLGKKLE